jgi:prolipoprotein diacylglyceryltransferase/protein-S-isoprenylcysteine O-methyltransferase Ste14
VSGRLAYAALFCVALPALLAVWAVRLDAVLDLPAYGSAAWGGAVAALGLALMAAATRDLWVQGQGLPASPFPPRRLVTRGVYGMVAHPVYVGAVLVSLGASLAARSAAGLWIVTPVLALAVFAFVAGFERDSTLRRYGALPAPLLSLPAGSDARPSASDRASVYALVFLPWLAVYLGIEHLGVPPDARSTYMAWDRALPVLPWTEAIYVATYLFVGLAPLAASRKDELRRFALGGLWASAILFPLYLLLPLVAEAKPVPGDGLWQELMRWERQLDRPVTAFPAFHVVWACLAAGLYSSRWGSRWPRLRWLWRACAAALAASCVTTGMHAAVDVAAGFAAYALVAYREAVWRRACDGAERLANSWREVTVGPVRLMSHGIYAGLGAAVGLTVAAALAGSRNLGWLVVMTLTAAAGAALWAQIVEGSPQLLRPYGYFGSVILAIATAGAAGLAGADGWLLLAALATGSCFAHAIGRMRCLVQGCCHGREAPASLGIRYEHPLSRVVRLTDLGGVPVHPTPLYSAVWMLVVGLVLVRLWMLAAPLQLIVGAYLLLVGLGRFVEEHFRGEPQTRAVAGLRLYQWLAVVFVIGGAAVTALSPVPAPPPPPFEPGILLVAAIIGALYYLAYGADLPRSSRRFSRLR